jgi:hypothetical protein
MLPKTPEEICRLFRQYITEGNIDSVLSVYEPEVAFLNQAGEVKRGEQELRAELVPFAAAMQSLTSVSNRSSSLVILP